MMMMIVYCNSLLLIIFEIVRLRLLFAVVDVWDGVGDGGTVGDSFCCCSSFSCLIFIFEIESTDVCLRFVEVEVICC
jgi:hypothetical protein